jgi:hypothetical protein
VDILDDDEARVGVEADDYVSPMTIETYVEYRLRVLLGLFQKEAPPLSSKLSRLETLAILITASGTLLAAVGLQAWVAFTVALGTTVRGWEIQVDHTRARHRRLNEYESVVDITFNNSRTFEFTIFHKVEGIKWQIPKPQVSNFIQYNCLSPRLSSLNNAIRDLRNAMILMDSLSVVEKRTTEKKTFAVQLVESAVLNSITSWSGVSVRSPGGDKEDDNGGDGK